MCEVVEEGENEKIDEEIEEIESEELRNERHQRILNQRKEKSRDAARNRRSKENAQYEELANLLPFPPSVTTQLDKASIIRLTISYLKYHELLGKPASGQHPEVTSPIEGELGGFLLQALDGFLFAITQDGNILYISETVTTHLGLSQLDLIGTSIFSIVHPEDQKVFSETINRNVPNSFPMLPIAFDDYDVMMNHEVPFNAHSESISTFTRMKCALIKRSGCYVKSSGYKVIHVSGKLVPYRNFNNNTYYSRVIVATGQPLPPPTICELKIDTKVFVSRIAMDFSIVFCEGRIRKYLDFKARDIVGKNAYEFYVNEDMTRLTKHHLDCISVGKTVTTAYRWINKYGGYVWMQTVGTVIKRHGPQGEESQILCVNYISSEIEQENLILHGMQEKFKNIKLQEKSENTAESYDDFGVESRPRFTAEDVIMSHHSKPDAGELRSFQPEVRTGLVGPQIPEILNQLGPNANYEQQLTEIMRRIPPIPPIPPIAQDEAIVTDMLSGAGSTAGCVAAAANAGSGGVDFNSPLNINNSNTSLNSIGQISSHFPGEVFTEASHGQSSPMSWETSQVRTGPTSFRTNPQAMNSNSNNSSNSNVNIPNSIMMNMMHSPQQQQHFANNQMPSTTQPWGESNMNINQNYFNNTSTSNNMNSNMSSNNNSTMNIYSDSSNFGPYHNNSHIPASSPLQMPTLRNMNMNNSRFGPVKSEQMSPNCRSNWTMGAQGHQVRGVGVDPSVRRQQQGSGGLWHQHPTSGRYDNFTPVSMSDEAMMQMYSRNNSYQALEEQLNQLSESSNRTDMSCLDYPLS